MGVGSHAQKERFKQGIKESKNLRSDNLAKDGTYRGGRRVRAGDKPKPAFEKIQDKPKPVAEKNTSWRNGKNTSK